VAYRRRNEIEQPFRRVKRYRRVFCRFDRFDVLFIEFIVLALIVEALRFSVNRPWPNFLYSMHSQQGRCYELAPAPQDSFKHT
jgi:hypothetical protein